MLLLFFIMYVIAVHEVFVTWDSDTGKVISISIHAMLRQLEEDHDEVSCLCIHVHWYVHKG